ncbi:MAG: hypothetical protein O2816_14310 [Planctomycetota bacterium]|nr:hypothetical protein [Planctomycetota bacterium]
MNLRRIATTGCVALAFSALAQAQDGRWYDMATGGAAPSAGPEAADQIDPNVLFDLAGQAEAAAAELASARTDQSVRDRQRQVEDRLTALIGMLEREGG